MKNMTNHPGMQLRDDAADSWARFERDHGVHPVTSAYRSPAEQQALIDRWNKGGAANRPPYLYEPASLKVSKHLLGTGLDTPNAREVAKLSKAYGWEFNYAYDVVHLEYNPAHDQHRTTATPNTSLSQTVKNQQTRLNVWGARLVVDGIPGPLFKAATVAFQKARGLAADGIIGPQTWAVLQTAPPARGAVASALVKAVQTKLRTSYPLYAGKLVADGVDGPATRAAVKEFQRRSGLVADGIIGPKTLKALGLS